MDMDKILIVLGLLSVIIVMGGCTTNNKNDGYKELINSLELQKNTTVYYQVFDERSEGLTYHIEGIRDGNRYYIKSVSPFETRWMIKNGTTTYACVQLAGKKEIYCSDVTNNTLFYYEKKNLIEKLTDEDSVEKTILTYEVLKNASALNVSYPEYRTVAGRECKYFVIKPNYRKLTFTELLKIGLSPNSKIVTSFNNFTQRLCLDNETGLPLLVNITYTENGIEKQLLRKVVSLSTKVPEDAFTLPGPIDNTTRFINTYRSAKKMLLEYLECRLSNKTDYCLKQAAYNEKNYRFCLFINDTEYKDGCLVMMAYAADDPDCCNYVTPGENKDICYYQYVSRWGNKTYCDYIMNEELKENCTRLNVTVREKKIECRSDADCHITGIYNQTCAPVNYTDNRTVPWKDEYSCYTSDKTSCICVNNLCQWDLTDELIECIDRYETAEIIQDIKKEKNVSNTGTNSTGK
ncbi:hypothetical protein J7K41_01860 [Candidatus Micrarchaeota archaeon]|nr:hypothetical protein [Candidatus Micrarchaeota archaeon]